jgi:hypothetical protein
MRSSLVERELQKRIDQDKKLKRKHLKVKFFYVSVSRDEIFTALAETDVSNIFKYYVAYRLIGEALEERRGVRESQER